MDRTVGVMGLGIMGSAMAGNLVKTGFRVLGCDIDSERTDAFAANGGEAAPSPRAVADEAGACGEPGDGCQREHRGQADNGRDAEVFDAPDG